MDYYGVLGVSPRATNDEIATAYHHLALTFHPDKHPAASPAERLQFEEAMARINEAYSVLQHADKRAAYDQRVNGAATQATPQAPRSHPPSATQCMICGSEPVMPLYFQYQHAFLFRRVRYSIGGNLCKQCAQSLGRSAQNRTLMTGWWGVISFFANLAYIWSNTLALLRASGMRLGMQKDRDVERALPFPMDPGKPVFARFGVWVAAALLAAVVAVGVASSAHSTTTTPSAPSGGTSAYWGVGNCVAGSNDFVHPVACTESHVGKIVASQLTEQNCPDTTDSYVTVGALVYCIDKG